MVATSDIPWPFPFSCSASALASTFFSAIPSLIAFSRSDLTSSCGFLTIGGAFFRVGGEVIDFLGEEELGREPLTFGASPFSTGGGGGGGGGGIGAEEAGGGARGTGGGGGEGAGGGGGRVSPSLPPLCCCCCTRPVSSAIREFVPLMVMAA